MSRTIPLWLEEALRQETALRVPLQEQQQYEAAFLKSLEERDVLAQHARDHLPENRSQREAQAHSVHQEYREARAPLFRGWGEAQQAEIETAAASQKLPWELSADEEAAALS